MVIGTVLCTTGFEVKSCSHIALFYRLFKESALTQPLQNFIGPTIRIGREILCLLNARFCVTRN